MAEPTDVPAEVPAAVLGRLRRLCLALPEAYEEPAWTGVRWCVRRKTFAHVVVVDGGWPPVYARAAGTEGPATVLTFESSGDDLDVLRAAGHPFFAPSWRRTVVGMVLGDELDWDEVAELLTDSYRVQAPRALADGVVPPGSD